VFCAVVVFVSDECVDVYVIGCCVVVVDDVCGDIDGFGLVGLG